MNTKIILREDVAGLGNRGDTVSVKPGYARNYLMPQGLAYEASEASVKRVAAERKRRALKSQDERRNAEELASRIAQLSLTIQKRVAEDQTLYGSVTAGEIAEAVTAQGVALDRKQVVIHEPIKKLGLYDVELALHPEVKASVKLWVVKEDAGESSI